MILGHISRWSIESEPVLRLQNYCGLLLEKGVTGLVSI